MTRLCAQGRGGRLGLLSPPRGGRAGQSKIGHNVNFVRKLVISQKGARWQRVKGRYRRSTRQPQGVVSAVAVLLKRCVAFVVYEFCQGLGKRYVVVEGGWVV